MSQLMEIYNILYSHFGPQGWWPAHSKGEKRKFEICIGAILTQNTAWANVEKAIINLKNHGLLDIGKIRSADEKKLAGLIKSSGYYNQKAKRLKRFAAFVYKKHGSLSKFFLLDAEKLRQELLQLNGIGPETADSIMLYSAQKPVFVIDAYTKRIFNRLGFCRENVYYDDLQKLFMQSLPPDISLFSEYHALIVEHAKSYCRKRPLCEECVLNEECKFGKKIKCSKKS